MATIDPPPGFRDELLAAIAVLDPEIDGLEDLGQASISADSKEGVAVALGNRARRRDLIRMLIAALDEVVLRWNKLKDDHYPNPPVAIVPDVILNELKLESDSIAKATKIFEAIPSAAKIEISLGGITNKEI